MIENAKQKYKAVRKLAKQVSRRTAIAGYSVEDMRKLAKEHNAKLPKGSKNRIRYSGMDAQQLAKALGLDKQKPKYAVSKKTQPAKISQFKLEPTPSPSKDEIDRVRDKAYAKLKKKNPLKDEQWIQQKVDLEELFFRENWKEENQDKIAEVSRKNYQKAIEYGKSLSKGLFDDDRYTPEVEKAKDRKDWMEAQWFREYHKKNLSPPPEFVQEYKNAIANHSQALAKQRQYDIAKGTTFIRKLINDSPISKEEANKYADGIRVDASVGQKLPIGYTEEDLRRNVGDFYRLTSGKIGDRFSRVKSEEGRAYFGRDQSIPGDTRERVVDIGQIDDIKKLRKVLFHELGHSLETAHPSIKDLADNFINSRIKNKQPVRLNTLNAGKYDDDEYAYQGDFAHPYVGKVYANGKSTEVVSVGLEAFHSPETMMALARKDPEHFALILAIAKISKQ